MKTMLRIGCAGVLMLVVSACSAQANDPVEGVATEPTTDPERHHPSAEPSKAAEPVLPAVDVAAAGPSASGDRGNDGNVVSIDAAKIIAELQIADDHTVTFTEIESGGEGPADIVVSESHGKSSPSALTTIADLRASTVTAHDVFFALSELGVAVPPRIKQLDRSIAGREQGWGLGELKKIATVQPMLAGANACANASFEAATYGGILPNNSKWLDRHPSNKYSHFLYSYYGPNGLTNVSTDRFDFTLARYDISQYRGKACLESIEGAGLATHRYYHHGLDQWMDLNPVASFQYRRPGDTNWTVAKSINVPANSTKSMEWAWFGHNNEKWDWRMTVSRALPQDYVDYMRSYLD
jgi:hypothetical protein